MANWASPPQPASMSCSPRPNAALGNQQTAQMMEDDILTERIPIADGPSWGRIDGPGLGVEVDEDKLMRYHEAYKKHGDVSDLCRENLSRAWGDLAVKITAIKATPLLLRVQAALSLGARHQLRRTRHPRSRSRRMPGVPA